MKQGRAHLLEYLVRWKEYGLEWDRWYNIKELNNAAALVNDYKASLAAIRTYLISADGEFSLSKPYSPRAPSYWVAFYLIAGKITSSLRFTYLIVNFLTRLFEQSTNLTLSKRLFVLHLLLLFFFYLCAQLWHLYFPHLRFSMASLEYLICWAGSSSWLLVNSLAAWRSIAWCSIVIPQWLLFNDFSLDVAFRWLFGLMFNARWPDAWWPLLNDLSLWRLLQPAALFEVAFLRPCGLMPNGLILDGRCSINFFLRQLLLDSPGILLSSRST